MPCGIASRMPFSTAGMKFRGIAPPTTSSTNSKPLPRGSGSSLIHVSANCPRPPDCFLYLPCTSARPLIVSRYGTFGALSSTSTPYLRFKRSTATSTCSCPEPETMISRLSASRSMCSAGSSSIILWSACVAFSSSALLFGCTANEMTASNAGSFGKSTGAFSSESVSPVAVSLSLATAQISPAIAAGIGDCFLPSSRKSCPKRSFTSRLVLSTVESLVARPETTRSTESLPAKGSMTVLNTSAANGAAGSAGRSTAEPVLASIASIGGTSTGDAQSSTIASRSAVMPTPFGAAPTKSGRNFRPRTAVRSPRRISSSESSPLSR